MSRFVFSIHLKETLTVGHVNNVHVFVPVWNRTRVYIYVRDSRRRRV